MLLVFFWTNILGILCWYSSVYSCMSAESRRATLAEPNTQLTHLASCYYLLPYGTEVGGSRGQLTPNIMIKQQNINVKNFHWSLTTVVRVQMKSIKQQLPPRPSIEKGDNRHFQIFKLLCLALVHKPVKTFGVAVSKRTFCVQCIDISTKNSAVAERPRDASCHWIFC